MVGRQTAVWIRLSSVQLGLAARITASALTLPTARQPSVKVALCQYFTSISYSTTKRVGRHTRRSVFITTATEFQT